MAVLLGIEIGGTKLQLGVGRGDGTIDRMVSLAVDPPRGAGAIRDQILSAFRDLDVRPEAVGVGFGGPVDADRGLVILSNQIDGWNGFPLAGWVRSELGVSAVSIRNDSDTAALGEARFGAGMGLSPVLYVNSGSGIGGGLIVDGHIYRGSGSGAIEIGHLWVTDEGSYDIHSLILEHVASGWAIAEAGRDLARREAEWGYESDGLLALVGGDPEKVTGLIVAQAARHSPDGYAARILDRATRFMGRALAHAVTLLSPRRIILGGGVSMMDEDLWLAPIRKVLEDQVFPPFRGRFDLVTAALGQDVVVHGALALASDVAQNPQTRASSSRP